MIVADIDMKRDMDLIRAMLLAIEAHPSGYAPSIEIPDYTQDQIGYHAYLLGEAGLAVINDVTTLGAESPQARVVRLTWAGHEFLDLARENKRWNIAKDKVAKVGSVSIQILSTVLSEIAKKELGYS
ncbi:MAG: DUF2513 domain-containing protein [Dehalococcoidales bacterium]